MSTRFSLSVENERLPWDVMVELISRDQILRRKPGREKICYPVVQLTDHEHDWQPYPVDP